MSRTANHKLWVKRLGKLLAVAFASLLLLVALLVSTAFFLVGTEPGTRATLQFISKVAPGELTVAHRSGHLLGRLELERIRYQHADTNFEVRDLVVDWVPRQLWQRTIVVNTIEATTMQIALGSNSANEQPQNGEAFAPVDISLPVNIHIHRIDIRQIDIKQGDFAQRIDRFQAELYSEADTHRLERLSIAAPQGELHAKGTLQTSARYPLALELELSLPLDEQGLPTLDIQAMVHGDLDELTINSTTQGLLSSDIDATLRDYLTPEALNWQAEVLLSDTQHPTVSENLSDVHLILHTEGTLARAALDVSGSVESLEYGQIDLDIELDYADQRLDIIEFAAVAQDQPGEFTINGFAQLGDPLLIDINGEGSLLGFTFSEFSIAAQGNEQGASDLTVNISAAGGEFSAEGELYWQPELRWDIDLAFAHDNLNELSPEIRGDVQGQLSSAGSYAPDDNNRLNMSLDLQSLQGAFEGQPIHGQGSLTVRSTDSELTVQADTFELSFGQSFIEINGQYMEDNVDLQWSFNAPSLRELYRPLGGNVESSGHIRGRLDAPTGELSFVGQDLAYEDFSIARAELELTLDGSFEKLPTGRVEIRNFSAGEHEVQQLQLEMTQSDARHEANLRIKYEELETQLRLAGDWSKHDMQWQGELSSLEVRYPELGRWRLTEPAALLLSPDRVQLERSCLLIASRESEVCLATHWDSNEDLLEFNVTTENLPYQLLSPFMPEDMHLRGEFSLNADLTQRQDQLNADIRLNITDSSLRIPAQDLQVDIDGGEILSLQGDHNALQAQLRIVSDQLEGGIESDVTLYDVLSNDRRVEGFVGVDVRRLTLISLLIPDIQNVAGHLNGRIDVEGPLDDLSVSGGLALQDGQAELPATGLDLRELRVVIEAPDRASEPFTLEGSVTAGEGQIALSGEYFLQQQMARLLVNGDAFPALNTRDLQVTIAPQLEIEYTPELLKLRGSVDVPRARVTPPDFETVDSISSDTVFVGRDGQEYDIDANPLPLDMDLTVRLGDDVQVNAYGFEGRLTGRLRVVEQVGQETTAVGNIDVAAGEYELYGQSLNIERGRLIFTGGPVANPGLDLRVERRIELDSVTVGARVGGTLQNPTFNLFSSPTMQDSAILSYLLFGRGPGQSDSGEANMLARATLALGMSGGNRLGERLTSTLGVDEISLDAGDTFESTALYIGKQISSRLYIRYGVGLVEPVSTFFIMYRLTDNLNFESHTGSERSGADFFYSLERD